jgi:hypothetical protein
MISSTSHSYTIEKLNDTNWHAWKPKSKAVLISDDLWKVTDPSTSYTNFALGPKAYSKIMLLVDSEQLVYINGTEDPRYAWKALQKIYEESDLSQQVTYLRDLVCSTYEPGASCKFPVPLILKP